MISVTTYTSPVTNRLRQFPSFVDRMMKETVDESIRDGDLYMTGIVPVDKGTLASAVQHSGPIEIGRGHFIGIVGVDQAIAPHAEMVDKGTGVDGIFKSPVSVIGPRTSSGKSPVMRFVINGTVLFRRTVKAKPSERIQRSKNFSGRTYDHMKDWARINTSVLATKLALYFVPNRR